MEQANNLEQVLDGIFAGTVTTFTTSAGTEVRFPRAGIVQLGKATKFINHLIQQVDKDKVDQFLQLVAKEQTDLLSQGKSVYDINMNTASLLSKALNNHSLLLEMFGMMAEVLPEFVTVFTSMPANEYEVLSLDEQLVIAAGILIVNYAFFTQSLPPIMRSAMRAIASKQQSAKGKQDSTATK